MTSMSTQDSVPTGGAIRWVGSTLCRGQTEGSAACAIATMLLDGREFYTRRVGWKGEGDKKVGGGVTLPETKIAPKNGGSRGLFSGALWQKRGLGMNFKSLDSFLLVILDPSGYSSSHWPESWNPWENGGERCHLLTMFMGGRVETTVNIFFGGDDHRGEFFEDLWMLFLRWFIPDPGSIRKWDFRSVFPVKQKNGTGNFSQRPHFSCMIIHP